MNCSEAFLKWSVSHNPPDLIIQKDEILFLDFGPVFNGWEADLGRTYVVGNDPLKLKLKRDVEAAWKEAKASHGRQNSLTALHVLTLLSRKKAILTTIFIFANLPFNGLIIADTTNRITVIVVGSDPEQTLILIVHEEVPGR